jgi:formylglycine-generating enzyme required for sulfatase activity
VKGTKTTHYIMKLPLPLTTRPSICTLKPHPLILTVLVFAVIPFVPAPARAQSNVANNVIGQASVITPNLPNAAKMLWAATPGHSYLLQNATNVLGPFAPMPGHTNMPAITNYGSTVVPTTGKAQYFKLFQHDTEGPMIDNIWPADGAGAIDFQDPITARITDATGVDLNSLSIQVGTNDAVQWPDSRLTFANDVLTYTPSSESWGPTGATVTATLSVADTSGNWSSNTWSFDLLSPLVLADTVVFVDTGDTNGPGPHLTLVSASGSNTFVYSYPDASAGVTNEMVLVNTNRVGTNNYSYGRVVRSFVDDPASQTLTVFTRRATLADIYQSGSFRFHADTVTPTKSPLCVNLGNLTLFNSGSNPNLNLQTTPGTKICVDGSIQGGIVVKGKLCCPPRVNAGFWIRPSVTLSGELALQATISDHWSGGDQIHITTINVADFVIPPGIPADISIPLDLPWSASFDGTVIAVAGFDFSETACYTVSVPIHGNPSLPASGSCSSSSFTPIHSLTGCGSAEFKFGFSAGVQVGIFDDAGYVAFAAVPYVKVDGSVFCAGSQNKWKIDLSAGMDLTLTVGYDILDTWSGSKSWTWSAFDPKPILGSPYSGTFGSCPGPCQPVAPGPRTTIWSLLQGPIGSFADLKAHLPFIGVASYNWGRMLGSNTFLPFTDDSHFFNVTGDTLHVRKLALSDAGTIAARIVTPGGVTFLQSQLQVAPAAPAYPSLVWIPPGAYVMGSSTNEAERSLDEDEHTVTISRGFYIGQFEVTQDDYFAATSNNPSFFSGTNLPVESVTWEDATNYCRLLTQQQRLLGQIPTNWTYRLPTEAEWEYACRTNAGAPSGTLTTPQTAFSFGPSLLGQMANFYGPQEYDSSIGSITVTNQNHFAGQPEPVGSYPTSVGGLCDTHGNVAEWCQDWYGAYPTNSVTDPKGPGSGTYRTYRGGSWQDNGVNCRTAGRFSADPTNSFNNVGFRVVLAPQ